MANEAFPLFLQSSSHKKWRSIKEECIYISEYHNNNNNNINNNNIIIIIMYDNLLIFFKNNK